MCRMMSFVTWRPGSCHAKPPKARWIRGQGIYSYIERVDLRLKWVWCVCALFVVWRDERDVGAELKRKIGLFASSAAVCAKVFGAAYCGWAGADAMRGQLLLWRYAGYVMAAFFIESAGVRVKCGYIYRVRVPSALNAHLHYAQSWSPNVQSWISRYWGLAIAFAIARYILTIWQWLRLRTAGCNRIFKDYAIGIWNNIAFVGLHFNLQHIFQRARNFGFNYQSQSKSTTLKSKLWKCCHVSDRNYTE